MALPPPTHPIVIELASVGHPGIYPAVVLVPEISINRDHSLHHYSCASTQQSKQTLQPNHTLLHMYMSPFGWLNISICAGKRSSKSPDKIGSHFTTVKI